MAAELFAACASPADERSDVFALGSILSEILTGEPAYRGNSLREVCEKARRGEVDDALGRLAGSEIDAELASLARDCLSPNLAGRPRHAGEVAARMADYLEGVACRLREAELAEAKASARADEEGKRRRLWAILACLSAATAIVAAIAYAAWDGRRREREASASADPPRPGGPARFSRLRRFRRPPALGRGPRRGRQRLATPVARPAVGQARLAALGADLEGGLKRAEADRKLLDDLEIARFRATTGMCRGAGPV